MIIFCLDTERNQQSFKIQINECNRFPFIVRTKQTDRQVKTLPPLIRRAGACARVCVVRSLIVFVVVVVFCLLPLHVVILLTDYEVVDTDRLYVLAHVSLYMFAINSVFNAVIVTVISHQYRRQVLVLFGICLLYTSPSPRD